MTDAVRRTDAEEGKVIDDLCPALRKFAVVAAPADVKPDDLLQEALVRVLGKAALSDLDHPAAYLTRTMVDLAASPVMTAQRRKPCHGSWLRCWR